MAVMLKGTMRSHVKMLSAEPRVPGSQWHKTMERYIRLQFTDYGYSIHPSPKGVANVVGEIGPPDAPLFVMGAHYDSVPDSPGADDNASGVAALLEVARAFAEWVREGTTPLTRRVQLVAYDEEERGLLGSMAHCAELKAAKANVTGMISLEMLGFTSDKQTVIPGVKVGSKRGDFLAIVANESSEKLLYTLDEESFLLPVEQLVVAKGSQASQLAGLSDHGAFWAHGWPALLMTDTAFLRNPHYHQATDTADTLDYNFLKGSALVALDALQVMSTAS
jgi:Zn-dependent M28 family amino/carboxypeptidase